MATLHADELALSVVVPVRDAADCLNRALAALRGSDLPPGSWELIVVDDGSGDGSPDIAARYADRVVRVAAPGAGRSAARNRGAEVARAPVIVFVDADVCVRHDALRRIRDLLAAREDVSAVFGAYDLDPPAPGLVSQYRNLLHSYVHRRDAGEAVTFWTGLGAIRRDVFQRCGALDEQERLEDVELGYRIARLGHRILLDPAIQASHLKRWTLGSVIRTDVVDRGVPWVRLLLQGRRPRGRPTLNLRRLEQLLTGMTGVAIVALAVGLVLREPRWLLGSGVIVAGIVGADWRLLVWLASRRGWLFALRAIPLRLLYFVLNVVSVGLALTPLWARRLSRPAHHIPAVSLAQPAERGVPVELPTAGDLVVEEPLVAYPEPTRSRG
jgi:cellulose synthase/poly-beta-1,6-N-acetylglucosamine synthase-like glycosyltransferase